MEGFLQWLSGKESAYQCRRPPFLPWVGKIPWRRARQPTPVFLPGKSHGQRSLAGYSPWCCKRVGDDLVTEQQQVNRGKHVFGSRETGGGGGAGGGGDHQPTLPPTACKAATPRFTLECVCIHWETDPWMPQPESRGRGLRYSHRFLT